MENKEIKHKIKKKPWPTKRAMEQVYEMNLWGSNNSTFYSGKGSHKPEIINPYIKTVRTFLKSFKKPLIVCDLGCGDFNVGKELVNCTKQYIGVDIVTDLIEYNKQVFEENNLEFHCLDIAEEDLPKGDCVLLRQVLQHLSNHEIEKVVSKLSDYKYVILTEHLPVGNFIPNKNIISGQGIRIKKKSGVNLLVPPFCLKIKKEKQLLSVVLDNNKGVIITTLYILF